MIEIPFWKTQAIGNDFVLIHGDEHGEATLRDLAIRACRRRFGIGSDGLLTVAWDSGRLRYRMFNPDGTEDFCGNGLRCAALHARLQGWAPGAFTILHRGIEVEARIQGDSIWTSGPPASYDPEVVPTRFRMDPGTTFDREFAPIPGLVLRGSALSTGSTHLVISVEQLPDDDVFCPASLALETDPEFPDRTSVIWMQETAPNRIRIRIWERGAGETLGCGTGSSAAAIEHMRIRKLGGTITVENPGGEIEVEADDWRAPITLRGTANEVFTGVYRFDS